MVNTLYLEGMRDAIFIALVAYAFCWLIDKALTKIRRKSVSIDIAQLAKETAVTDVEFDGGSFRVWYRPNRVTTKWVKSMRQAENEKDEDVMMEELSKLVKDWDITDGDDKLPVNADTFSALPLKLMQAIIRAVMSAATGGGTDEEGKVS